MLRLRKAAALGLAALMTVGSLSIPSTAGAAGLPTTQGHDKYVNKNVFDVISSDTFGTKELESPLFDKTTGSNDITDLQVPTLAYDDTSIGLVWQKPEKYDNVADYKVYINGEPAGTARENYKVNAAWAAKYMESFYDYYNTQGKSDVEMVNVDIHAYRATGLKPDTEYTFKVVAVDESGKEIGTAKEIKQRTTKAPEVVNIKDFGAVETEGYTSYNDEINAVIESNTKAIQAAINACPEGGKVVIPENTDGKVFVSGAVWLKSDMTLEVDGTLWASPNSDHFEIGFLMYPFYTDTRGWGLVNAMTADESNPIKNVRVTGTGTLYGNGWKYGAGSTIYEDGYTSNKGKNTQAGDPTDTENWGLPRYVGGGNVNVFYQGIQSKDSAYKYLKNTGNYDEDKLTALFSATTADEAKEAATGVSSGDLKFAYATRSSLLIMRNCENVYVGDITIENPSNHSVNILDSRNIATTNVKVFSYDGNNGDGLGYGCSQNVVCWGNFTDTGDDNLGFGASVGMGARDSEIQTNSEVWMFDNFLREGHGGLAAGSHTGNGIQDVLFEDTVMNHIDMAFRFKSAPTNGGFGANITMRDCAVADTNQGWVFTTSYGDPNSASSTEYAEIGEFYNFASYNVSVYGANQNTIQVLADIDPVGNTSKPLHSHHNMYFQDITFGNVGSNGSYKNKNGWETLIGCDNSVFYNVKTVSYNKKAESKKTNKAWNNIQYCNNLVFQGTTWDSLNACTDNMKAAMSGITVKDNTVKAENYKETPETPDKPDAGDTDNNKPDAGTATEWTSSVDDCTDFFNDAVDATKGKTDAIEAVPKVETKNTPHNIGYLYDNEHNKGKNTQYPGYEQGYAYTNCDIAGLTKLVLPICRQTDAGTQTVSVRLDAKDGKEIAKTTLKGVKNDGYVDYEMDVTLPEGVDTTKAHKIFVVFTSTGNTANYIANARDLKGIKTSTAKAADSRAAAKESVDLTNGLTEGIEYNKDSAYATVSTLETAGVNVLSELSTPEQPVTIDGVTYTQFIQASTAAGSGVKVPDNGTATYVFKAKTDCSVTLHNRATSKEWWFVESPDGAKITNSATGSTVEAIMTFNLKAGKTYYYYCAGSKPMVYGIYLDAPVANADSLLKEETATGGSDSSDTQTASDKSVKLTWTAVDNDTEVYYGVDTYVDGVKVDMVDGIKDTSTIIDRLSAGVEYTFKVYVSEKADNANSLNAGNNKTYLGEATFTTEGSKDTAAIAAKDTEVSLASAIYTCAQATWTGISKDDTRIRGYKIYANGNLVKTLYNYQINKYDTVDTISNQVGRLTPGIENKVQIVAFTDAGVEYKYPEAAVKTLENYDYKAPVWSSDAAVTAKENEAGDIVITWDAATDDTKVGGYRVYLDGVAYGSDKYFNPVNGAKTTEETTYTIKKENLPEGFKASDAHTVTIQAGDTWWKAETTMGAFDKMAGFNWTNKGLSTAVENYKPEPGKTDTKIDNDTVSVDKEEVENAILTDDDKKALEAGQNVDIKISVTDASNEVSSDAKIAIEAALKAAADKDASVNVGQYLDISIKKTVGEASSDVTETAKAISFTVDIPETMKNTDKNVSRTYYIIRMHDGKAEVIPSSVENDKITFATDKFSTYALAYADASVKSDDGTNTNPDDSKKDDGTNTNPDDSKKDDTTITTPDDSKKDDTTITTPDDGKKDDTTVTTPDNGNNAAGGTSTGSTTDTTATTPKTGDTNASMWMLLAIMGMAGIAFVTAKKRGLVRK